MTIQRLQTRPFTTHIILVITLLLLNPSNLMAQQTVTFSIQQQTKEPIDAATIIISDQKTGKVIANGLTETTKLYTVLMVVINYTAELSDAVILLFFSPFQITIPFITSIYILTVQS